MEKCRDAKKLESLHTCLLDNLKQREYLRVVKSIGKFNSVYISMSSVILKLAIEQMNTKEYEKWKSNANLRLVELLEVFRNKWSGVIDDINKKRIGENCGDTDVVDRLLKALEDLRSQFTIEETSAFFTSSEEGSDLLILQQFGNGLRASRNPFVTDIDKPTYGGESLSVIAGEVSSLIEYYRKVGSKEVNCFIIDAFRNPAEVEFFRRRYANFFLVSISTSSDERRRRLKVQYLNPGDHKSETHFNNRFEKLDKNDWGIDAQVSSLHLQNVSECCHIPDISISNEKSSGRYELSLFRRFLKYFALVLSPGCIQPTKEETYMNLAYSLSLRSSCISRQVGAVITDKDGYVLGQGWNDAGHGQVGCGLRHLADYVDGKPLFKCDLFIP